MSGGARIERPSIGQQMLLAMEAQFYAWEPLRDTAGTLTGQIRVSCRHCPFAIEFDDLVPESFIGAGDRFIAHLKRKHAKMLASGVPVDLL